MKFDESLYNRIFGGSTCAGGRLSNSFQEDIHFFTSTMSEGDDVEIEDGSEGSEDDDVDIMDFIETDRTLEEEKALVDPQVWQSLF